jgi:hypothetical protein
MSAINIVAFFQDLKTRFDRGGVLSFPVQGLISIVNTNGFVSVLHVNGAFLREASSASAGVPHYIIQTPYGSSSAVWRGGQSVPGRLGFAFQDIGENSVRLTLPQLATSSTYTLSLTSVDGQSITRFKLSPDGAFLKGHNADQSEYCVVAFQE